MKYSKFRIVVLIILVGFILTGCMSVFLPKSGAVVDKASGLPIENVIVVRSWLHVDAGLGGAVQRNAKFSEIATEADGRFFFGPDVFFHVIPFFTWTEENPLLFYKPGYEAYQAKSIPSTVTLEAIPQNRSVRKLELEGAERHHFFYESTLLKETSKQEEANVKDLTDYTTGVLYKINTNYLNNIVGVAFDNRDNIYISTRRDVVKISKNDTGYDVRHADIYDDFLTNYWVQVASDFKGNLYFMQNGNLKIQNETSPTNLNRFKTERNPDRELNLGNGMIITNSNYQPKDKGQSGFPNDNIRFAVDQNGNLQFGNASFSINGNKIGTIAATPDPSVIRYPETVETVFDKDGKLYIVYNDKYNPSNNAIAISSNGGKDIKWKNKLIGKSITGIAITDDKIYLCDKDSFYILDKNFKLVEHKLLSINVFGKVRLNGIKVDRNNKNLILIDAGYARLLSYNLETDQWNSL